jgi:hypothetical protein
MTNDDIFTSHNGALQNSEKLMTLYISTIQISRNLRKLDSIGVVCFGKYL